MILKALMFPIWGVAGLILAIFSSQCRWVDPVLPAICIGTLIGFILYKFLGQEKQGSAAEGILLGWKFTVNGAIVVVGLVSALIWAALSNGRTCVGEIDFKLSKKGNESELIAETSSSPGKTVGVIKDKSFESQPFINFVNDDFFHPVLIQLRSTLCPGVIADCFQGASFRLMVLSSPQIQADDVIEVCTDRFIGSQAREIQEILQNKVALAAIVEGDARQSNTKVQVKSFRIIETKTMCRAKASRFRDKLKVPSSEPVRIFALASPRGFQLLTGSDSSQPQVVNVSLNVGKAT